MAYESEHYVGNEYFHMTESTTKVTSNGRITASTARPACGIRAKNTPRGGGFQHKGPGSKVNTPHDLKTKRLNQYKERLAKRGQKPKLKGVVAQGADAIVNTA